MRNSSRTWEWRRSSAVAGVLLALAVVSLTQRRMPSGRFACGREWLTEAQLAARFGVTVDVLRKAPAVSSVTYESLCMMRPELRAKALRKAGHPKPDHPGEAVAFRRLSLQDENGEIPEGALLRAADEARLMRDQPGDGAGLSPGSWTWLGPGNIGGRMRSILINPAVPSTMLAGSVGGGIWRTTNGGTSWAPVQDFMANLAVATMVAQPSSWATQYAGTGEGFYNGDGLRGAGIFKSTDEGVTWSQLSATNNVNYQYVNRLAISADSTTLLAATRSGIYRSTDGGASFGAALTGVSSGVMDLDFHPTDSSRAVAGGHEGRAWYSTNGGVSWNNANGLPVSAGAFRRVEVSYARSSPNIVYASIDLVGGSLYKSIDGGVNYSLVFNGTPDYLGGQGWYDNALWVDPTNPDFIVVGGIDLYRSTNGGVSFTPISSWWASPLSAHADHHVIVEAPGYDGAANRTVWFGNDGGIYRAANVATVGNNASQPFTNGWQEFNNNLGVTQFYGAGVDPASGLVVGGTQDNGTLTYTNATGTDGWVAEFGGDGGWSAVDYVDPSYCYGEYVYLQIHRSSTGCDADSGDYITNGLSDAGAAANFIAPFILDPNDPQRILAGGLSLWRTNNARAASPAWAAIKPASSGSYISAVAVQEGNPDHIWVGHNNGDVYKTLNGSSASPTWSKMDGTSLPNRLVTRVAIDKFNPDVIYVTFGGFASDNIYRSSDGGATWLSIHRSLPAAPIRSIVMHPAFSQWLYVGTEVGVFASEDSGGSWFLPTDGPANVSVDELFFGYGSNVLHAATHGRGLYRAAVGPPAPPGTAILIAPNTYINNTMPTYQWRASKGATYYQLFVTDKNTSGVVNTWYTKEEAGCAAGTGTCQVTPTTALAAGAVRWWIRTWSPGAYAPWSVGMRFFTDTPTAEVTSLWPVPVTTGGQTTRLWARVQDTGAGPLPTGSRVWFYISGPGLSQWLAGDDVSNLQPGANMWFFRDWEIPIGQTAGSYSYGAQVWWGGTLPSSPFNGYQIFTVDPTPAAAARVLSTWAVNGAYQGGSGRLWALVRNTGTDPLPANGNVWFRVSGPNGWCGSGCTNSWVGYKNASTLASGAAAWYFADWPIPGGIPIGTSLSYAAQVWTAAPISAVSDERAFTIGVDAQFNGSLVGWTAVNGTWTNDAGAYLYSPGLDNTSVSASYPVASFSNFDFSARLWRNGSDSSANAVFIRGNPTLTGSNLWTDGYLFEYTRSGYYSIWKILGGAVNTVQGWTTTGAIVQGSAWNVLRITASGSNLSYYINGTLVWNGSDSSLTTGKVGVTFYRAAGSVNNGLWVDYVVVDGGTVPRLGADAAQQEIGEEQRERNEAAKRFGGRPEEGPAGAAAPPARPGPSERLP